MIAFELCEGYQSCGIAKNLALGTRVLGNIILNLSMYFSVQYLDKTPSFPLERSHGIWFQRV